MGLIVGFLVGDFKERWVYMKGNLKRGVLQWVSETKYA